MLAAILYIPANLLPVLTVVSFGRGAQHHRRRRDRAVHAGMLLVALLVFFASILVPVLKLLALALLLVSIQRGWTTHRRTGPGSTAWSRTGAGRWSTCS